ncbi:hypothetical protein Tco_1417038 [Tanacetum coccineum]
MATCFTTDSHTSFPTQLPYFATNDNGERWNYATEGKSLSIVKAIHEWNFCEVCHYSIAISKDFIMVLKKIMLWDKGPIFEHCLDFDMAFMLFHGHMKEKAILGTVVHMENYGKVCASLLQRK